LEKISERNIAINKSNQHYQVLMMFSVVRQASAIMVNTGLKPPLVT